jgi:hypothetical protein
MLMLLTGAVAVACVWFGFYRAEAKPASQPLNNEALRYRIIPDGIRVCEQPRYRLRTAILTLSKGINAFNRKRAPNTIRRSKQATATVGRNLRLGNNAVKGN